MRVRALDANGDMCFGRGQGDFYVNDRRGVGQVVKTRLAMALGEWFLDTADGTPYQTQVFGFRTDPVRDPAIRARILATAGVTGIATYASQQDRATRTWTVQATVNTAYGHVLVSTASAGPNGDVRYSR